MSISEYYDCEDCYCDYNDYSDDYCSDDDDYCSDNEYDLDHIYEKMIKHILEWAKTQRNFNTDTIEGIQSNYERYNNFTENQKKAIKNIYFKFHVNMWRKKKTKKN